MSRIDALYADRDNRRSFDEQRRVLEEKANQPSADFETLWRAARTYFWLGDDPSQPADLRSKYGKIGWDYAERAIALHPQRPEGHYWAAVNIGSYALGLGVIKAISIGLEGKFKERLGRAEQLAPGYNFGGVGVAWGRFYEKLPWPKRDRTKAEQQLRKVLGQINPANLRARVYLADTLAQDGRAAEAVRLLDEVAAAPLGKYDAPEEHRAKALAEGLRPAVTKLLK
jgi:tetratricopeptide (TPR) repeat protein